MLYTVKRAQIDAKPAKKPSPRFASRDHKFTITPLNQAEYNIISRGLAKYPDINTLTVVSSFPIKVAIPNNVYFMDLSRCRFEVITTKDTNTLRGIVLPPNVGMKIIPQLFPRLTFLDIQSTYIDSLPTLPNLVKLYAKHSTLTQLDTQPNLQHLDVGNTPMLVLPELPNLDTLIMHDTCLSLAAHPLPKLNFICAFDSQLSVIPAQSCSHLEYCFAQNVIIFQDAVPIREIYIKSLDAYYSVTPEQPICVEGCNKKIMHISEYFNTTYVALYNTMIDIMNTLG